MEMVSQRSRSHSTSCVGSTHWSTLSGLPKLRDLLTRTDPPCTMGVAASGFFLAPLDKDDLTLSLKLYSTVYKERQTLNLQVLVGH